MKKKHILLHRLLNFLFWFFYAATVILWFKNSFPQLKKIPVSPVIPLAAFILISALKFFSSFRIPKKPRFSFSKKKELILLVILAVSVGVRIPWLLNGYGVNTSDDAITMLMAKHIAEGKLPPIYFYGQLYQGSLYSHITALFILCFGYSDLLMKLSIFIFFLAFIALQFFLVEELFSLKLALSVAFFYSLPIGHLIYLSFFNSAAFPLVLLLGSLIIYLTIGIIYKNKTNWIPGLGFCWGLAFWTHQITIGFIATSAIVLIFNWKNNWKKFLYLPIYTALGGLPLITAEFFWKFPLLRFLLPTGEEQMSGNIFFSSLKLIINLFSQPVGSIGYIGLTAAAAGSLVLILPSIKSKRFHPQSVFSLFFFVFFLIFLLSGFSRKNLVRYLYPLYFCLPVLLLGFFEQFRFRLKSAVMILVVFFVFAGMNLKGVKSDLKEVKFKHQQNTKVIAAMKKTGIRYWRGPFWAAYLLTALTGEEIIVDSFSVNRYYPYKLMYDNQGKTENFVFITQQGHRQSKMADRFIRLLDSFDLKYKKKEMENYILIYDIEAPVSPSVFVAPAYSVYPFPKLLNTYLSKGMLNMVIINSGEMMGADYWIFAEIPGYSSVVKKFPVAKGKTTLSLPSPPQKKFPVSFHLNYKGLKMANTETNIVYEGEKTGPEIRNKKITYLSGFGSRVKINNQAMRVCFKEATIEIRQKSKGTEKIQIHLYSPFNFNDFPWYGDYSQEIRILINGKQIQKNILKPGRNIITFSLPERENKSPFVQLTLLFKYHSYFNFAPYGKTSALLSKLTFN